MLTIYCDGGSRGNPGPAASAFVVYENDHVVHTGSKFLGSVTNNIAEYNAVLLAMNYLNEAKDIEGATIVLDSELVKKQLSGEYRVKSDHLKELFFQIKSVEKDLSYKIIYSWKPRENNKLADALVNEELDKFSR